MAKTTAPTVRVDFKDAFTLLVMLEMQIEDRERDIAKWNAEGTGVSSRLEEGLLKKRDLYARLRKQIEVAA